MKSREWTLGKLFIRWGEPEYDVAQKVGNFLMHQPACSSKVLIMRPSKDWHCEVIADSSALRDWLEERNGIGFASPLNLKAADKAMQLWLRGANTGDPAVSCFPEEFSVVIAKYLPDLIDRGIAKIVCIECDKDVRNINKIRHEHKDVLALSCWTDEWRCPEGHLLRLERQELICILRNRNISDKA